MMSSNISKKSGEKQRSYCCRNAVIENTGYLRELTGVITAEETPKINNPRIKWHRIVFGGRPKHSLLMMDLIGLGNFKNYARKIYQLNYKIDYCRQLDHSRWISEKDRLALDKIFAGEISKNPEFLYKLAGKIEKIGSEIIALVNKYKKTNWVKKSDEELISVFDKFSDLESRLYGGGFWFYGWHLFFKDAYLKKFKDDLESRLEKEDFKKIWDDIMMPTKALSQNCFSGKEKIALYELAKKFVKQKDVPQKYIEKHLNNFAFVNKDYFRGEGFSYEEIHKKLKKIIRDGEKNINKGLKSLKIKNSNLDKFALSSDQKTIIKGFRKIGEITGFADEATNYFTYYLKPLFEEIAKRLKIDYEELISMRFVEIKKSLEEKKTGISRDELRERHKEYGLIFSKNDVYVLSGKNLKNYKRTESKNETKKVFYELKGTVVSKTDKPLIGNVIIKKSSKKLKFLGKNSILVTETVYPDHFLPVIENAKAIITDEGGLLCHAAIISREFGIPCIVGTKIATRVLKNNDLVEINTDSGIIKILRRKTE